MITLTPWFRSNDQDIQIEKITLAERARAPDPPVELKDLLWDLACLLLLRRLFIFFVGYNLCRFGSVYLAPICGWHCGARGVFGRANIFQPFKVSQNQHCADRCHSVRIIFDRFGPVVHELAAGHCPQPCRRACPDNQHSTGDLRFALMWGCG